jgi:hypothetical protein
VIDHEGWQLPSLDSARARAVEVARRMTAGGVVKVPEKAAFLIMDVARGARIVVPFAGADEAAFVESGALH